MCLTGPLGGGKGGGLATLAPTTASAAPGQCVAGNPTQSIAVFAFNDFHGRIYDDSRPLNQAGGYLAGRLFTPVERARAAQGEDNVLLISSGDNIGASTFVSMVADDLPTLDVLNAAGIEASTVGNHEFDKGWTDLAGRVVPKASGFDYLGANVYERGTTTVAAVNRVTAQLLDGNAANGEADVVLASLHEGAGLGSLTAEQNAAASPAFASIYRDIDERVAAIFNAHTHQEYTYTSANQAGRPIIQAGSYAGKLARVGLVVDTVGKGVCEVSQEIVSPAAESDESLPRIEQINDIARAAYDVAMEEGQRVIGTAKAAISTAGDKGNADIRNVESPMSNLVAQMFSATLSNGDKEFIGVQNPGGTRDSFDKGDVTFREAALTLPFANSLFTTSLTGAQFKKVLEQQWQRDLNGNVPTRAFLQLGLSKNVSYTYDESLPEGSRITSVSMNGKPMSMKKTYRVGSGSFLITGGDNFWEFANGANTADTGLNDLSSWVDYVKAASPLKPDYTKRGVSASVSGKLVPGGKAVTVTLGKALADGVAPQTLDMLLVAGNPKVTPPLANTKVKAYLGKKLVGTGKVTDGVGTVKIALKKGAKVSKGTRTLKLVVSPSGTRVLLPVEVSKPAPQCSKNHKHDKSCKDKLPSKAKDDKKKPSKDKKKAVKPRTK